MPRRKPNTLIVTVGTSLDTNLSHLPDKPQDFHENPMAKGAENVRWETIERIQRFYKSSQWKALGKALAELPGDTRLCGAEINSVYALKNKGWVDFRHIVLFTSDTEAGCHTGEILKAYYETCKDEYGLQQVSSRRIEQLQDARPWDFRTFGLRNLVKEVGKVVQDVGDPSLVAIDATGGYKAQIAAAALIGVALDIEVYYKHDRFNDIISFPPLPVALDYELLGKYGRLLHAFEDEGTLTEDEVDSLDEELELLLDKEVIDGKTCYALSHIGEIYLTGFRLRNPRTPAALRQAPSEERKAPAFPHHHYPDGFKDFVLKVWNETPWVTTCIIEDYSGQAAMKKTGFDLRDEGGDMRRNYVVIGTYVDRTGFAARFRVMTTSNRQTDLIWAVEQLNQKYGR